MAKMDFLDYVRRMQAAKPSTVIQVTEKEVHWFAGWVHDASGILKDIAMFKSKEEAFRRAKLYKSQGKRVMVGVMKEI